MKIKEFLKLDLNSILLVDIREEEEFKELPIIRGAIHIPKDKLIDYIRIATPSVPLEKRPIYLICRTWQRTWFMELVAHSMWYNHVINVEWWMEEYLKYKPKVMKIKALIMDGCSPCMAVKDILDKMDLWDIKLNYEDISKDQVWYIEKYKLRNIPTLIFEDGNWNEKWRLDWWIKEEEIYNLINN